MSNDEPHYTFESCTLRCAHCRGVNGDNPGAILGTAVLQRGRLLVSDRGGTVVQPSRGSVAFGTAKGVAAHFAESTQQHVQSLTDDELTRAAFHRPDLDPDPDMEALTAATQASLARVHELEGGSTELTYEFACNRGHRPKIEAHNLALRIAAATDTRTLLLS